MVTKSAVKNTLATPSSSNKEVRNSSSVSAPFTYVPGPPTGSPTENLRAFGFGVGSTVTGIAARA